MHSWLSTFRTPERPPIANLAIHIFQASLNGAEALKESIHAADEKDRTKRLYLIELEFLYLFMHMTNRVALAELGHERRARMQAQLGPLIFQPTIESIFGHLTPETKDGIENEFFEKLNCAELEYAECKQLLDPEDPLASNALFSKFAAKVCGLLGNRYNPALFGQVTILAADSYVKLNLPETIRALGKQL